MTETNSDAAAKGGWEAWAMRTTAILAVLAALSSGRWGASNLQAILEQGKVNDTWAYYQAKSIKEHTAEETRDLAKALAASQPGGRDALVQVQAKLDADAERERIEKEQREKDAHAFEQRRNELVESSLWYEISFACLQLGVILCTIAAGAKNKLPWGVGIAVGLIGLVLLVNGFYRVIHAPRSWYEGTSHQMGYNVPPKEKATTSR